MSAVAALVILAILFVGGNRLRQVASTSDSTTTELTSTDVSIDGTTDDGIASTDALTSTTNTVSSIDSPLVRGGLALLGAIALLTIGRSLGRQDQSGFFGTPSMS